MKTLFTDADGIPQFINAMEVAQQNSKRSKLVIQDKYMQAVSLKSLLQSGEYKTEIREWTKLPDDQQTWTTCKTTSREAYVVKRRAEASREGEGKPFGSSTGNDAQEQLRQRHHKTPAEPDPLPNQMLDSL